MYFFTVLNKELNTVRLQRHWFCCHFALVHFAWLLLLFTACVFTQSVFVVTLVGEPSFLVSDCSHSEVKRCMCFIMFPGFCVRRTFVCSWPLIKISNPLWPTCISRFRSSLKVLAFHKERRKSWLLFVRLYCKVKSFLADSQCVWDCWDCEPSSCHFALPANFPTP